jgi:ankyrin repeat protein
VGGLEQLVVESKPRLDVLYPSSTGVQETVLHLLARRGYAAAVEVLLRHGAPVRALNSNRHTPLDVAAGAGHTEAVRVLRKGAPAALQLHPKKNGELRMAPTVGWRIDGEGWTNGLCTLEVTGNPHPGPNPFLQFGSQR